MLTIAIMKGMLHNAALELKENVRYLCELDSAAGDGDHGLTVGRMADEMKRITEDTDIVSMKDLLEQLSDAFMNVNGGSAGPLWGTIFEGLADGTPAKEDIAAEEFRQMFICAREAFMEISKAREGDKTMADALLPAVKAAEAAQGGLQEIMDAIASAAADGAEATVIMVAKYGRAKNIGERSLGSKDPGAVSLALLFDGMAKGVGASL